MDLSRHLRHAFLPPKAPHHHFSQELDRARVAGVSSLQRLTMPGSSGAQPDATSTLPSVEVGAGLWLGVARRKFSGRGMGRGGRCLTPPATQPCP